jgi:transcription antitermination factor NusG
MPWYVIYTQPRNEKKVVERLEKLGIDVFCPMITQVKQWSDRKKLVTVPLINSYVFVNINEVEREKVLKVFGVIRFVFWLGKPATARQIEINSLKKLLNDKILHFEVKEYKEGDIITISSGLFQGKEGKINKIGNNSFQLILKELGVLITLKKDS